MAKKPVKVEGLEELRNVGTELKDGISKIKNAVDKELKGAQDRAKTAETKAKTAEYEAKLANKKVDEVLGLVKNLTKNGGSTQKSVLELSGQMKTLENNIWKNRYEALLEDYEEMEEYVKSLEKKIEKMLPKNS